MYHFAQALGLFKSSHGVFQGRSDIRAGGSQFQKSIDGAGQSLPGHTKPAFYQNWATFSAPIKGESKLKKSDILGGPLSCRVSGPIRWLVAFGLVLFSWQPALATNHFVRINELMAGLNGDSSIQFFEMVAQGSGQKNWSPSTPGRAMVVFFDSGGVQTGRFVVPTNPGGPADTVLFATQAFADLTDITPDFIIPAGVMPIAGKVCFKNNPDSSGAFNVNLCLSYGGAGFTGATEEASGSPFASDLLIMNSQSLSRNANFSFGSGTNTNANFALAVPTPNSTQNNPSGVETNTVGEAVLPVASSMADQGDDLFFKERFLGNGRTCGTCHFMSNDFGLTPAKVATLPATDLLFMNTVNVNTLVVNSAGSVNPGAGSGTTQPSDFFLGTTITGTMGGTATVLAGTGTTYHILGGSALNVSGNVISDAAGNTGTLVSFTAGNLVGPNPVNVEPRGIEDTAFMTGGRALITENINGFPETTFMRMSPNLLNLKHTAPYGLSGEFADLQAFAKGAVQQHFPRHLQRVGTLLPVAANDFRLPTTAELDAMAAFMDTIFLPSDENFDEGNNFNKFVTTEAQKRGRALFFGTAKCGVCHSGNVLATSDGQFGTTVGVNEEFNTGVANLPINTSDGLPTEQDLGFAANSREFSTRPLFGVKNTAPFFHDNSVATLLGAIQFYDTAQFVNSPAGVQVGDILDVSSSQKVQDIQAFLEGLVELPFTFTRTLNLGNQAVDDGATSAMTVTLTHTGTESLAIGSRTLTGTDPGEFATGSPMVDSGPFSNGQSRTIAVTFDPSSSGPKQATLELRIQSSSDSWDMGVALSGFALACDVAVVPADLVLANQTMSGTQVFRSESAMTFGPTMTVPSGTAITLRSRTIRLEAGVSIQLGATFTANTDPDPCESAMDTVRRQDREFVFAAGAAGDGVSNALRNANGVPASGVGGPISGSPNKAGDDPLLDGTHTFLLIDEDSIDHATPPNFFSELDVNADMAEIGLRERLLFFADHTGETLTLHTGAVGDEGWFALKTIPASWAAVGRTGEGLRNYLNADPGLGTPDRHGNPEALLAQIPDITPLRATGLRLLAGKQVCAVVYDRDVQVTYAPLTGSLQGATLGIVAFEILAVTESTASSPAALPQVEIQLLDADRLCAKELALFLDAPEPSSSSEPFDVMP